jgi:hypothetical protein
MSEPDSALPAGVTFHSLVTSRIPKDVEIEMLRLHQSIETLLPGRPSKIIQFIGPEGGEGTTAIVKAFGDVVSRRIGKSVVSVDVERMEQEQAASGTPQTLLAASRGRLGEYGRNRQALAKSAGLPDIHRDPHRRQLSGEFLYQRGTLSATWSQLSAATDLLLLDTPSSARSAAGLAAAPTVDGVILVIEASRSGYAAVIRAKEEIERSGGVVLGAVLNKKRRYLPRFLERWV